MPANPRHHIRTRPALPPAGLLLGLIGGIATLWLAGTGQLALYIHPRYFGFTTVMAALGLLASVVAWPLLAWSGSPNEAGQSAGVSRDGHVADGHVADGQAPEVPAHEGYRHGHDSADPDDYSSRWRKAARIGGRGLAVAALGCGLLVLPPATLTSSTVEQRELNSAVDESTATLVGADPASFTLRDWAALLSNPSAALSYAGQQTSLTGFVTAAPDGDPNVFYLTRFVVTCCTVDAQPVGVPVGETAWADSYPVDGWLRIEGTFVASSDPGSASPVVLKPTAIQPVDPPDQPYDY